MTAKEIMRTECGQRTGYSIHSISTTKLEPVGCLFLRRLASVPSKISAYLNRDKIKEVFKTLYGGIDDTYYIVRATDGTLFHVDY